MSAPAQRWPGFKYEQVPGLANRYIARYLRAQRKNMRRFFEERGLFVLADRMKQIRNSRQGMLAKNLMFQAVLHEYSKLVTPTVRSGGVEGVPAPDERSPGAPVPGPVLQPTAPIIAGETENP